MSVQPPPPHGYGPPHGYAREHPDGTTVLVPGILSLAVCGLLGPFAWAKGNDVLAEIDRDPYADSNRSSVVTGRICGMVARPTRVDAPDRAGGGRSVGAQVVQSGRDPCRR
jgi:hypothetical protein